MNTPELLNGIQNGQSVYLWVITVLLSVVAYLYKENRELIKKNDAEKAERIKRLEEKIDKQ